MVALLLLMVLLDIASGESGGGKDKKLMWNEFIDWVPWPQAIERATELNKPIFLLFHRRGCPGCIELEAMVRRSPEIEALSSNFVMTNVDDEVDVDIDHSKYAPQGAYTPRILFLHPNGSVADIIDEEGDPQHVHFYASTHSIVASMLQAMRTISKVSDPDEF